MKIFPFLLLLLLILIGLVSASPLKGGYAQSDANLQIQTPPIKIYDNNQNPAPDFIIQKANDYIIGFVGQDYFNSYFTLNYSYKVSYSAEPSEMNVATSRVKGPSAGHATGFAGKDHYAVVYYYHMPYKGDVSDLFTPGVSGIAGTDDSVRVVSVELNLSGAVMLYNDGPLSPHKFLVTKERALEIAQQHGLSNTADVSYDAYLDNLYTACDTVSGSSGNLSLANNQNQTSCTPFNDFVWKVSWNRIRGPAPVRTLYLDVDTGAIVKEEFSNALVSAIGRPVPLNESDYSEPPQALVVNGGSNAQPTKNILAGFLSFFSRLFTLH